MSRFHGRNSNVELLRICAMWLIVAHHYVVHNVDFPVQYAEDFWGWLILDVVFRNIGRVATGVFLMVTVWYLCEKKITLRDSFKRIWILERELLVYGLAVYICHFWWTQEHISLYGLVEALLPLFTGQWWFVSCYALLLVMIPFLLVGMRALTKLQHKRLTILSLLLFGLIRFIPHSALSASVGSCLFIDFVLIAIVIAYMRWHLSLAYLQRSRWLFLLSGLVGLVLMPILSFLSSQQIRFVSSTASNFMNAYFGSPGFIFSLAIEVAMLVCAVTARERHVVWINRAAAVTLGVYLISDARPVRDLLWKHIFAFDRFEMLQSPILTAIIAISVVYIACSLLDMIRLWLFAITVDRHRGRLFERCCGLLELIRRSK